MYCELVRGNEKIRGPLPYHRDKLMVFLKRLGFNPSSLPAVLDMPLLLPRDYSLVPVEIIKPTSGEGNYVKLASRDVGDIAIVYNFIEVPKDPKAIRLQLMSSLSTHHQRYESGRVLHRGVDIAVDLEARINASQALDLFKQGRLRFVLWRGRRGRIWVRSTEEMQGVYDAIYQYIENGFAAKEAAEEAISNATDSELTTLDPVSIFNNHLVGA